MYIPMLFVIPTDSIPIKGLLYGKPFLLVEIRPYMSSRFLKLPLGKGTPMGVCPQSRQKGSRFRRLRGWSLTPSFFLKQGIDIVSE